LQSAIKQTNTNAGVQVELSNIRESFQELKKKEEELARLLELLQNKRREE